jgi:hypothetical protein
MRRTLFVWTLVVLMASSAFGEKPSLPLQPGNALPPLVGQTLSGKPLELPAAVRGSVAVAIFSFNRTGGRDARNWAQRLSKDYPNLGIYNVIFLESVPRLFRSMVISEIRSGMPPVMQAHTLLLFQQQVFWEQQLQVKDENDACVVVLGKTGLIRGMFSGPFAEAIYARVKTEVEP